MQQRTDHRDHHPSPPSQGIKGAHIHDTTANPSFFPPPTISAFSSLDARRLPTVCHYAHRSIHCLYNPCPQLANDTPAPIVVAIISSKAPPLTKEVAEDLRNENKNRHVRTAINASRAGPVLASALENAFTEALSNAESNVSYKTVLHRRRMLTLWVIIIDNVTDGQVKGEDVWNIKVV